MDKQEKIETAVPTVPTFTEITLNALKCLDITRVAGGARPYKNTKEGSRYEGLTYLTYRYGTKGFTVPSDDPFNTMFTDGSLGEVKLNETESGFDFISAKTQKAMMNAHKFAVMQKAITVEFVQTKLTMEELNEAW